MTDTACMTCGAGIENTAVTGVLCGSCYDDELTPKPGWRDLFRGPNGGAVGFGVAPFVVSFSVNGLDYVALGCGAIAATLGVVGLVLASRAPERERAYRFGGAGLAVVLGLAQVARAFL